MSSIVSRTYSNRVHTDKKCTLFKWSLEDYKILENYYGAGIDSPKFCVTDTEEAYMRFEYGSDNYAYLYVSLPKELTFYALQMEISTLGTDDNVKVTSTGQVLTRSIQSYIEANSLDLTEHQFVNKLIPKSDITKKIGCLNNDTLTLLCEITIIKEIKFSPLYSMDRIPSFANKVRKFFKESFETQYLSDVTISVGNTNFQVHKIILAMNSPVFKAMFEKNMIEQLENTVTITDIDASTFEVFLKYLYLGSIEKIENNAEKLLIVADKYHVASLYRICEQYMTDNLNSSNVIEYLIIAESYGFPLLQKRTLEFAKLCGRALSDSADFDKLCNYPNLVAQIIH